jgi:hypothetical protein
VSGLPVLGRAVGLRTCPDGVSIEVLLSRAQWTDLAAGLQPGALGALTLCRPHDYKSYQIKGRVESLSPADGADHDLAEAYVDRLCATFDGLGIRPPQIAPWLAVKDLVRVRMRLQDIFHQTPGPGAGERVAEVTP